MNRKIIHIDMDAFYAAVEQRDFPAYRGLPVVVGGSPDARGVVSTCSYEARKFGIRSAMATRTAARLCPHAIFVRPRFDAYKEASQQIHAVFRNYTNLVEPLSLDEAYLDVSDCSLHNGSATWIAKAIKQDIVASVNLTASAGVSYNKFLAKIASGYQKPDGLTVITPSQGEAFVESLAIRQFYGVGAVTEKKMHVLNIRNGAQLKQHSLEFLQQHFGRFGSYLYDAARAVDHRPVQVRMAAKSIGRETTFARDLLSLDEIVPVLRSLITEVWQQCIRKNKTARTLTLKVRYDNFQLITRSQTLAKGYFNEAGMRAALQSLINKTELGKRRVRLVGVSLSNFETINKPTSANM